MNETFSVYTGRGGMHNYQNYATWQDDLAYFDHWGKENDNECNKSAGKKEQFALIKNSKSARDIRFCLTVALFSTTQTANFSKK